MPQLCSSVLGSAVTGSCCTRRPEGRDAATPPGSVGTEHPPVQTRARHVQGRPGQGTDGRGTRRRDRLPRASAGDGAGRSLRHVGLPTHGHGSPATTERCRCCCTASEEVTLTVKRHT